MRLSPTRGRLKRPRFGERALALLDELSDGARRLPAAALRRLRDLSAYNQLLLRYAFTSWAATRLDRQRSANSYDARGQLRDGSPARARAMGPRGVL